MCYSYNKSESPLSNLIDNTFSILVQGDSYQRTDLIVPDCTPGLLFVEQGQINRMSAVANDKLSEGNIYLFGQKTRSVEYDFNRGDISATGFKLYPYAIHKMFGISASDVTDKVIELKELNLKDEFMRLIHDEHTNMNFMDSWQLPPILRPVIEEIHRSKGLVNINELLNTFNIGYKKLERLFKYYIGITPKMYTRITRFNNSLKIGLSRKFSLTDVAYESGYFDQNHYIKEVKSFCDMPPGRAMNLDESRLEKDHMQYLLSRAY